MKWLKDKMEGMTARSFPSIIYALDPLQLFSEGMLPHIDINAESMEKMN